MTTVQDILKVARVEIGYKESYSNKTKFGKWYGWNGVAWCAIFVSYCFYRAGLPLPATKDKGFSYCPFGVNWFKANNRFLEDDPCVGDVVFFDWDRDEIADHIGIVEKINPDGSITTIEGNTSLSNNSNGGEVMRRTRWSGSCLGFGRPAYNNVSTLDLTTWGGRLLQQKHPLMRGVDVLGFQEQMQTLGYSLLADGIYGNQTKHICREFQSARQLTVDGVVGSKTWKEAFSDEKMTEEQSFGVFKERESSLNTEDIDILARTIYGEARGETEMGRIAVAFTVLNRYKAKSWYGDSIKDVCLQPWQFSVWNENDPNRKIIEQVTIADPIFKESLEIAESVLRGETTADPTYGSTHYYARYINAPRWARGKKPAAVIGNHLFFNDVE